MQRTRDKVQRCGQSRGRELRLASAVLSEISDDRETQRAYLNMEAR